MNLIPPKPPSDDEDNIVDLLKFKARPRLAGKEPPSGPDWLSAMKSGTEFLARDKFGALTPRWVVLEWIFGGYHSTGNVLLIPAKTPNEPKSWQWVDPIEFCRAYDFRGIIEIPTQDDYDKAEELNGNSDLPKEPI